MSQMRIERLHSKGADRLELSHHEPSDVTRNDDDRPSKSLPRSPIPGSRNYLYFVLPILLLLSWYLVSTYTNLASPVLLPTPNRVVSVAITLLENGELLKHVAASVQRVLIG